MSVDVVAALRGGVSRVQNRLAELVAIPGISANGFPPTEVRRSAEAVAETLTELGFAAVRLLETRGHPAVYGEMRVAADAPAVLVYGHHDAGREAASFPMRR